MLYSLIDLIDKTLCELLTFLRGIEKFLLWLCEAVTRKIQLKHRRIDNFTFASAFFSCAIMLSIVGVRYEWERGNYANSFVYPIVMILAGIRGFSCIPIARKATLQIKENTFGETWIIASLRRLATLLLAGSLYGIIYSAIDTGEVPSEKILVCAERFFWVLAFYFVSVRPHFPRKRRRHQPARQ